MKRAFFHALFGRSLRVVGPFALFALLGGPTPGSVGSCGGDDFQEYEEFCNIYEGLRCERLQRSGAPICSPTVSGRCYDATACDPNTIAAFCAVTTWDNFNSNRPCVPPPTVAEVNACILSLLPGGYDPSIPEGSIPQCNSLCQ